ncbi:MFS transporter [Streptomyces sp. NPDC018026]|uniref:MFS transporter n=1 Tax=Streptomyces sp. NPDC018026 TaxID=3365031 RepID=UPI0037A26BDD
MGFRRYWTAQTITYLGDQVTIVALPLIAVVTLDAGPGEVAFLSAAGSLPSLLFSLHAGAFVDRSGHRRRMMVLADLGRALLLVTVPVAYALDTLSLNQLYVVAFCTGVLAVFFNLCATGLFTSVVPRADYVAGMSLVRGSYSFSWTAGPSIGGVLVQVLSAPVVLVLDVLSFLGSASLVGAISAKEPPGEPAGRGRIKEGLRFVVRTPALLAKFVADASLNFFYSLYFALLILFATRELGLAPGLIGLVLGGGALGALIGSAAASGVIRRIGIGPAFFLGSLLYPGALVLAPLARGAPWFAALLLTAAEFASGFGLMVCDIAGSSIQQALTPDRLRARVQGAYLLFDNGARPLGALAGGALGTWLGLRPTLWVGVVGGVVCVLLLLLSAPIRTMRELPQEAA